MTGKNRPLLLISIAVVAIGIAHAQVERPGVGPVNPNHDNRDFETTQQIQLMDQQRRLEELRRRDAEARHLSPRDQAIAQAQVAKFIEAIKHRRNRFPDFDKVVIRSNTPVTPAMLALVAESPYAADIAYYLGKHPDQSVTLAVMQPAEARLAIQRVEATAVAENAARK